MDHAFSHAEAQSAPRPTDLPARRAATVHCPCVSASPREIFALPAGASTSKLSRPSERPAPGCPRPGPTHRAARPSTEKNGLHVRRISVSDGTERTARSPRGLKIPRRSSGGGFGISSRPYTRSDGGNGIATCDSENTSRAGETKRPRFDAARAGPDVSRPRRATKDPRGHERAPVSAERAVGQTRQQRGVSLPENGTSPDVRLMSKSTSSDRSSAMTSYRLLTTAAVLTVASTSEWNVVTGGSCDPVRHQRSVRSAAARSW